MVLQSTSITLRYKSWLLNVLLLLFGVTSASANNAVTPEEQAYLFIEQIADRTCKSPETAGWIVAARAGASASLDITRLKFLLGPANLSIKSDGTYAQWKGLLQKDIAAALVSHNDCAKSLFVAMISRLPIISTTSGTKMVKPRDAIQTYNKISNDLLSSSANNNTGAGQQQIITNSSNAIQIGGPSATNAPAYQFIYPPVTADQKEQAKEALLADLKELSLYPERGTVTAGVSIVQQHFRSKAPRSLYLTLSKYNHSVIASIPNGDDLNNYVKSYYEFEASAPQFEFNTVERIHAMVPQQQPYMWSDLLDYCIVRAMGFSAADYERSHGTPNFGITAEEQETVYQKLSADPIVGPGLLAESQFVTSMSISARELLARFR